MRGQKSIKDTSRVSSKVQRVSDRRAMIAVKDLVGWTGRLRFEGRDVDITRIADAGLSVTLDNSAGYFRRVSPNTKIEVLGPLNKSFLTASKPGIIYPGSRIGTDPEIFALGNDDKLLPAFTFLPDKKHAVRGESSNGALTPNPGCPVYWDGFQAEFETNSTHCMGWLSDSIRSGLKKVWDEARQKDPKAKLSRLSVVGVDEKALGEATDEQVQLGCAPSLNTYGLDGRKENGRDLKYRFAGGHMHFGLVLHPEVTESIVKALDAILGVACVSLFAGIDNELRRLYYGLPGEYRLPKHGLEYRTLSNAWLIHPILANLVFDLGRKAVCIGYWRLLNDFWDAEEAETVNIILSCDVKGARAVLRRNLAAFTGLLSACYYQKADTAVQCFLNGADTFIKDMDDIVGNWQLNGTWLTHCDNQTRDFTHNANRISTGLKC